MLSVDRRNKDRLELPYSTCARECVPVILATAHEDSNTIAVWQDLTKPPDQPREITDSINRLRPWNPADLVEPVDKHEDSLLRIRRNALHDQRGQVRSATCAETRRDG